PAAPREDDKVLRELLEEQAAPPSEAAPTSTPDRAASRPPADEHVDRGLLDELAGGDRKGGE
ncbi:MAG: hypothetical protein KDA32_12520, partial [Phycisphaerales bacterium]|nr:hypothetical protein [Phycisphaerales bacterium]